MRRARRRGPDTRGQHASACLSTAHALLGARTAAVGARCTCTCPQKCCGQMQLAAGEGCEVQAVAVKHPQGCLPAPCGAVCDLSHRGACMCSAVEAAATLPKASISTLATLGTAAPLLQVAALEGLARAMFVEVMELRRARRRALESRTLPGHAKNLLGYCFSAYCLYRCGRGPAPLPALPYPTKNLLGHCFSAYCPHRRGRGHAPARPRPPGAPGPPALCALCGVLSVHGSHACCVVRPVLRAQAQRAGARAGQDVLGGARARAGRGPALGPGQHRARPGPGRLHARPPGHQRAAAVAGAPGGMACMQAPHAAGGGAMCPRCDAVTGAQQTKRF